MSYVRQFECKSSDVHDKPCQAYQIIGVDIMLRDDFSCVLLEVNNSPSFNLSEIIPIGGTSLPDIKHGAGGRRAAKGGKRAPAGGGRGMRKSVELSEPDDEFNQVEGETYTQGARYLV